MDLRSSIALLASSVMKGRASTRRHGFVWIFFVHVVPPRVPIRHSFPKDACNERIALWLGQYLKPSAISASFSLLTLVPLPHCVLVLFPTVVKVRNESTHRT